MDSLLECSSNLVRPPQSMQFADSCAQLDEDSPCDDQLSEERDDLLADSSGRADVTLAKVPKNKDGQFTSIGSIEHDTGTCKQCLFWYRGSCAKGVMCTYCHIAHKGEKAKRIRPGKKAREHLRSKQELENIEDCSTSTLQHVNVSPSLPPGLETPVVAVRQRNVAQHGYGTNNSVGCQQKGGSALVGDGIHEPSGERAETKLRASAALFHPKQQLLLSYIGFRALA